MVQQTTAQSWQAEARSEETTQFIKNIKRLTRRKFTAEENPHCSGRLSPEYTHSGPLPQGRYPAEHFLTQPDVNT